MGNGMGWGWIAVMMVGCGGASPAVGNGDPELAEGAADAAPVVADTARQADAGSGPILARTADAGAAPAALGAAGSIDAASTSARIADAGKADAAAAPAFVGYCDGYCVGECLGSMGGGSVVVLMTPTFCDATCSGTCDDQHASGDAGSSPTPAPEAGLRTTGCYWPGTTSWAPGTTTAECGSGGGACVACDLHYANQECLTTVTGGACAIQ